MSENGKGSAPRPFSVDHDTYSQNFERIFGPKKRKKDMHRNEIEVTENNIDELKSEAKNMSASHTLALHEQINRQKQEKENASSTQEQTA